MEKNQILKLLAGVIIAITICIFVLCILMPALDKLEEVSGLNDIENIGNDTKDTFINGKATHMCEEPVVKYITEPLDQYKP